MAANAGDADRDDGRDDGRDDDIEEEATVDDEKATGAETCGRLGKAIGKPDPIPDAPAAAAAAAAVDAVDALVPLPAAAATVVAQVSTGLEPECGPAAAMHTNSHAFVYIWAGVTCVLRVTRVMLSE